MDETKPKGKPPKQRRCRYGAECRNIDSGCKFYHPPPGDEEASADEVAKKSKKNGAAKPKKDKSKIQCRYGMECRNTKCPFFHHPAVAGPTTDSSPAPTKSPTSKDKCIPVAATKTSPNNLFSHVLLNGGKPSSPHKVSPNNNQSPSPLTEPSNGETPTNSAPSTPSRKTVATTKKKCRWGAGCRNKKCSFLHPGQTYDKDAAAAVSSPIQKSNANGDIDENKGNGHHPKSMSEVLPQMFANANATGNLAPHPILPPSPPILDDKPPNSTKSTTTYPPGLLFSSPESAPNPQSSPASAQTSDAMYNLFTSVFNTNGGGGNASGIPVQEDDDDNGYESRTPLYSKSSNAYNNKSDGPPSEVINYHPVVDEHRHPQNHQSSSDTDFLFELLGINPTAAPGSQQQQQQQQHQKSSFIEDVIEEDSYKSANIMEDNAPATCKGTVTASQQQTSPDQDLIDNSPYKNPHTTVRDNGAKANVNRSTQVEQDEKVKSTLQAESQPKARRGKKDKYTPKGEEWHVISSTPNNHVANNNRKELISEDEMTQSRRAALELRLESQQNGNNHEVLCTLLATCRSKQDMIKTALEQSMSGEGGNGADAELDETNLVALLDLNELLVGAISIAESSLRITQNNGKGNGSKKGKAAKSQAPDKSSGGTKNDKNTTTTKTATKKSKPNENTVQSKQSGKKSSAVSFKSEPTIDIPTPKPVVETVDLAQQEKEEKEKMAKMLEEARKQASAAKEKKKSKKNKKFDRWLKENEAARESRVKLWSERIAKENDYIDLIERLLVAEFIRQSKSKAMGLTAERVLSDPHASEVIAKECREAYNMIFGGEKCRVVVAGSENKDMNGRQGTIQYWDKEKEKFCVGLDTKKCAESDVQFVPPEILDAITSARPSKGDKKTSATSYDVDAPDFMSYGGVSLGFCFTLLKSHVIALGSSESMKKGLDLFCKSRDEDERRQKREAEAEKKREEEDRKRRAARRAQENAAWERRKEQMRKDKEEYEEMKKEWRREKREKGKYRYDYDDDDDGECQCPRCRFGDKFSSSGGAFFFNIGGIPFRVRFDSYDSEEESFFDDEFDDRWEEQLEEEREEENRKQAKILGKLYFLFV